MTCLHIAIETQGERHKVRTTRCLALTELRHIVTLMRTDHKAAVRRCAALGGVAAAFENGVAKITVAEGVEIFAAADRIMLAIP